MVLAGRPGLLSRLVGEGPEGFGQVVGLDVSDEMIRQARAASKDFDNILYVWGSAQQIPWEENFFDKVLSVESFYYYPDQDRSLTELFRVMAPHGRLFILINLYKDNPYSLQWVDKLKVPVHVRSAAEYVDLLRSTRSRMSRPDKFRTTRPRRTITRQNRSTSDDLARVQENRRPSSDGIEARSADARSRLHDLLSPRDGKNFGPHGYFTSRLYFFSTSRRRS